ncbi:MAG: hypothetical protein ACPG19_09740 [Saprospiraceae bacterium]
MKIAPIFIVLLLMTNCVDKNVQLSKDRLLVGDWILTEMTHDDEKVNDISSKILYQFTADRQLVIKQEGTRNVAKYIFKNNILIVDDGVITKIKEQIVVTQLDKNLLILSFKIDGFPATMKFVRESAVLN